MSDKSLDRTILWLSHIVVMHRDSDGRGAPLRFEWKPDTPPDRSVDEARRKAHEIQALLRRDPSRFAEVARASSDDVVTKAAGGSLGGVSANSLPAAFLDAVAAMPPGEVSEVIQTALGFHIILRRSPPPREDVRGQRIVIRYATTFGEPPSARTRAEAMELARAVTAAARKGEDFSRLVAENSGGLDRERGGRMGLWSTNDPGPSPTVIEALASMKEGDISDPIDTMFGFQIVQRLPPGENTEFGARTIELGFNPADPASEKDVAALAKRLAGDVAAHPGDFRRFAAQYCCLEPKRWADGHGHPRITSAVEALKIGETSGPVRLSYGYVIAQRLDPELLPREPDVTFDLPEPRSIDLEPLMAVNSGEQLANSVGQVRDLLGTLKLDAAESSAVKDALDLWQGGFAAADTGPARLAVYREGMNLLHRGLSESSYSRVVASIQEWVMAQARAKPRS